MAGTKQIRLGKVQRFVERLEIRKSILESTRDYQVQAKGIIDEGLLPRIHELGFIIEELKEVFGLE